MTKFNYPPPADIFSFGIVLCEMLCKCEPSSEFLHRQPRDFFALDAAEVRRAVAHGCPESLEALALQCCETEPSKRPTAEDCVEWLEVALSGPGSPAFHHQQTHFDTHISYINASYLLQAIVEDLDQHDALEGSLPESLSDISVPVGLMASQREGGVKYPKSPSSRTHPAARRQPPAAPPPLVAAGSDDGVSAQVLQMLQVVSDRVTYLEIQVQELRTENRCARQ
jgi:serine/threonine protein kinase